MWERRNWGPLNPIALESEQEIFLKIFALFFFFSVSVPFKNVRSLFFPCLFSVFVGLTSSFSVLCFFEVTFF